METIQVFDSSRLDRAGLNRQAVFNIASLPADIAASVRASCTSDLDARQLILIGHAGRTLWDAIKASGIDSPDPIDDFTVQAVRQWFAQLHPANRYEMLYPGEPAVGLQQLGKLAGWHHPTPFMVGIDSTWGTWFAYRALVVADTAFPVSPPEQSESPCAGCVHSVCIARCPASAMADGRFDLGKCAGYRKQEGSRCKATCIARISCPVGSAHRYSDEQIAHSYLLSMRVIEKYY